MMYQLSSLDKLRLRSSQKVVDVLMEEFSSCFSLAGLAMNQSKLELILFRKSQKGQKVKLLGVTVEKGYLINYHSSQVTANVQG